MQVAAIMSSPVVAVDGEATLDDAVRAMLENRVGSVLVIETGLWGILTRSDVLRALAIDGGTLSESEVTSVMTTDVATITPDATVERALRLMEEHEIKKLPVVADFEAVGIVTTTDIARHQPERVREVRQTIRRRDDWTD